MGLPPASQSEPPLTALSPVSSWPTPAALPPGTAQPLSSATSATPSAAAIRARVTAVLPVGYPHHGIGCVNPGPGSGGGRDQPRGRPDRHRRSLRGELVEQH